jgi:hypothetical protein
VVVPVRVQFSFLFVILICHHHFLKTVESAVIHGEEENHTGSGGTIEVLYKSSILDSKFCNVYIKLI